MATKGVAQTIWPWTRSIGKQRPETPPEIIDRLSMPVTNCGCYVWLGETNKQDYPLIFYKVRQKPVMRRAARVICELVNGEEIPEKMTVDHICHQTWCVNPDHLEVVSQGTNNARRRPYLRKFCKNGHPLDETRKHRRCHICKQAWVARQKERSKLNKDTT